MKKVCLIAIIAMCLCQVVSAQNYAKIDTDLQQEMSCRNASELIPINIVLKQQYNQLEMRMKSSHLFKKEAKRAFVVSELKRFSKEAQWTVLNYLNMFSDDGQVADIQQHWIYNGIYCQATKDVIETLATIDDILIIGFDKQYKLTPDVEKSDRDNDSREMTYNILKVNAHQVWDLGYTGDGVIVAVLDSGVNYNHHDLRDHVWEHPDYPKHGWNFVFNNNDPMDIEGHGTHCAGTVAGDGTSGSQTGMAPDATIMALKVWDDIQGLGGANTMSSGFAFAVEHGAHVISMSGGVPQSLVTDANKILLRTTAANTLAAGVIASVAAGNENGYYSPPNMVRCPSSCPPPWLHPDQTTVGGLSCVMSIGATDSNDNIAYFSSRGPVTWQHLTGFGDYPYNPGMGLIRPDVSAPGVDIKSLSHSNPTGYVSGWSGTSMATPCVAGVMALMLSKNIELTPAEICEILETTAVRLPTPTSPKGNIFGSGRIDALEAVNAVQVGPISVHEVVLDDSEGNNNGNANPGETILLDVSLINDSNLPVNNVTVTLTSTNEFVTILNDFADYGNFAPGEIKTVTAAFKFELSPLVPAKKKLDFKAEITTADDQFSGRINLFAFDYELRFVNSAIDDAGGNGILDPGETADIIAKISNAGNEPAIGLTGFLTSSSDIITINSNMKDFGNMDPNQSSSAPYNVTLDPSAVPGSVNIPFNLLVTDEDGRKSSFNFVYKDKCAMIFSLQDGYGDGWNGNQLVVSFSDGSPTQNLTITNGYTATYTIEKNSGVTVSLSWILGSYVSECSFQISYQGGEQIYAASGNPGSGIFFFWVVNCGGTSVNCESISDLTLTINNNTAELNWVAPTSSTPNHYAIYNNFVSVGTTTNTYYSTPLISNEDVFCVYAVFDNCLIPECITASIDCPAPSDIVYDVGFAGNVETTWNRPIDDSNLIGYNIYIDGEFITTIAAEEFYTFIGEEKVYHFCVSALHNIGGVECESVMACEDINVIIVIEPPVNLTATPLSASEINLFTTSSVCADCGIEALQEESPQKSPERTQE